ncbi:vitamin B6 photo-protection and homoeostasis-domain-containing protein [Calycina marina]|uniref:Vitamin B6 photo-protection and homoeostasis-domain-containing protein n=1 Tax=Calycina marina TaxID=1763456 RepID=A0A9P7Z786_9HELO|nr:vitamin B6 photo-protection and homoeostasis-domain-containing protein [Calycina marina]
MSELFVELDEAKEPIATYVKHGDGRIDRLPNKREMGSKAFGKRILSAFLPAGYPISVTPDYLEYQIYDSLQAFSSSIAGLLSSRAVLEGIGVGDSHASPTSALLLSVLQESMGRIATILFAHRFGTALEPECKMYRLLADIFNDAAMILDCLSPAFPRPYRVLLMSFSSMLRSLCGVAAGSAKASLSAHFATQGNLGELNAKDSSQETVISLIGMLVGTFVVSYISSQRSTWIALITLLCVHLGTNYLAVRAVSMKTLNRQRACLLFSTYFDQCGKRGAREKHDISFASPTQISAMEHIFQWGGALRWKDNSFIEGYCEIGVPLSRLFKVMDKEEISRSIELHKNYPYIIGHSFEQRRYIVVLKDSATPFDQLSAWMLVVLSGHEDSDLNFSDKFIDMTLDRASIKEKLLEAGWDIETGALEVKSGTRLQTKHKQG